MKKLIVATLLSCAFNCYSMEKKFESFTKNVITNTEKSMKKDRERKVANLTKQKEILYFYILKLEKEIEDLQAKLDSCQKWRIFKKRYLQKRLVNEIKLLKNRNEQHNELEDSIAGFERSIDLLERLINSK
jgi:peptidoglycan hydrolase CwlO-like protein